MSFESHIERAEELIWLCQELQSEKDGIVRPGFMDFDKSKTLDQFAQDINRSATYISSLRKLIPMMNSMAALGRKLESEGIVDIDAGEEYSLAALTYFMDKYDVSAKEKN